MANKSKQKQSFEPAYKRAGVDLAAGNRATELMKAAVQATAAAASITSHSPPPTTTS
jgi:phosphoribosylaminoimidazole (AIR) synthetase